METIFNILFGVAIGFVLGLGLAIEIAKIAARKYPHTTLLMLDDNLYRHISEKINEIQDDSTVEYTYTMRGDVIKIMYKYDKAVRNSYAEFSIDKPHTSFTITGCLDDRGRQMVNTAKKEAALNVEFLKKRIDL